MAGKIMDTNYEDMFLRSRLILGNDGINKLKKAQVWVFGVGGVGGYVVEALVRAGVGNITIVDNDYVNITNLNRQIIATSETLGLSKVMVCKERAISINPNVKIHAIHKCYMPSNSNEFDFSNADYVVDAIDTVTAKIDIILKAQSQNVKVISSMGTGNKTDNTSFEVTDIYKTHTDPLAKVMRRELKKRNVKKLCVVYSSSEPVRQHTLLNKNRPVTASVSWVPPVGGFLIAGKVINDILNVT